LNTVVTLLSGARFVDGKLSAGTAARRVKHSEELDRDATPLTSLNNLVMGNLIRHPTYQMGALPHRVAAPFYARYTPGMAYGDHIDDPVMGPVGSRYRRTSPSRSF
jgi:PKHD-type hydroxylase